MIPKRVVLLSGTDDSDPTEPTMRFRLTYEGLLYPSQPGNQYVQSPKQERLTLHKHKIRQEFHGQLKRLWAVNKYLSEQRVEPKSFGIQISASDRAARWGSDEDTLIPLRDAIAEQHKQHGFRFAPLVKGDLHLLCAVSILFLRRQKPGKVFFAGDLDNRIKTLIDALTMPRVPNRFPDFGPLSGTCFHRGRLCWTTPRST